MCRRTPVRRRRLHSTRTPPACPLLCLLCLLQDRGEGEASKERRRHHHTPRWAYIRSLAWLRPVLILGALYLLALAAILLLFARLPTPAQLAAQQAAAAGGGAKLERLHLAVPHSFEQLRRVRHTLELYRQNYAVHVAALLVATHIFLQAFMVPGSILSNILAGSMYSLPGE